MRVNLIRYGSGSDQGVQWACTLTTNGSIHILCCKTLLKTFFPVRISTILAILEPILNPESSTALTLNPFIQLNHRSRFLLPFIFSFFVAPYVYISYPFLIHYLYRLTSICFIYHSTIQCSHRLLILAYLALLVKIHIHYSYKFTPFFVVHILLGQVAPLLLSIEFFGAERGRN